MQNGSLYFNKIKLPKSSLMNNMVSINENGKIETDWPANIRAEKNMDTLTYWHIAICSATMGIIKATLTIGMNFSRRRWNVSQNSKIQYPLLTFQTYQHSFIPLVARAMACNFFLNFTK